MSVHGTRGTRVRGEIEIRLDPAVGPVISAVISAGGSGWANYPPPPAISLA